MLSLLHIENIAVIESADIVFGGHLNILTGETGAGKSIVLDALGAVLGSRTSRELIRTGFDRALVSAVFCNMGELNCEELEENCDELIVSREMFSDGRNICKINGRPATVAQLRKLSVWLAQIHGQHDTQGLLSDEKHLALLDEFARTDLTAYREQYAILRETVNQIDKLQIDEEEKARRIDSLEFRIAETEAANLTIGEEQLLLSKRTVLRNAKKILDALNTAVFCLSGDDEQNGAGVLLHEAASALRGVSRYSDDISALSTKLDEIYLIVSELTADVRVLRDDNGEDSLEAVEERLALLYKLKTRFGLSPDELITELDKWREELENIILSDEKLQKLEQKRIQDEQLLIKIAEKITKIRKKAAEDLTKKLIEELGDLDMKNVRFMAEFLLLEPTANGMDDVRFLLSANMGEDLRPLSKIASGGELARIMLAMKSIFIENNLAALIFDEIDAGVSGRAAQKVAEKLHGVSKERQVICVTHLPQIAAMADAHLHVSKSVSGGRTVTEVRLLTREERVDEIAHITAGNTITEITVAGASEMIAQAEAYKKLCE